MAFSLVWLGVTLVHYAPSLVDGHGYMVEPPSRMSAWRLGFAMPVNYNDNEMFCGGLDVQQKVNGGKCGVCGDVWSGPRPYERPNGTMVQHNIITKTYQERDSIKVVIHVTKNHWGWNEFRLCDIAKSGGVEATQECLNLNLLADDSGKTRFYFETDADGLYEYQLALPLGLTCSHCMLQWKWKCGNNWGCDAVGCAKGRGEYQEEFYACADVTILPRLQTSKSFFTTTEKITTSTPPVLTESTITPRSTSDSLSTTTLKQLSTSSSTLGPSSEPGSSSAGSTSEYTSAQPSPTVQSTPAEFEKSQVTTQTVLTTPGSSVTSEPSVTLAPLATTKSNFLSVDEVLKILSGSSNLNKGKLNNTNSFPSGNTKTAQEIMNLLIKQSQSRNTGTGNSGR